MMKWYVKELANLIGLSVQTLHHYDRVGLLKPTFRESNGYRLYSEADLSRLQKILALKSFGFSLSQIKTVLEDPKSSMAGLQTQIEALERQASDIQRSLKVMKIIQSQYASDKSIPWKKTLELIEVYEMSKKLEKKWIEEALNPEELKKFVEFETQVTDEERTAFQSQWVQFTQVVEQNLHQDPRSEFGMKMGEKCMQLTRQIYKSEDSDVRKIVWDKGFKGGHADLNKDVVTWIDQATDAYWRHRLYGILDNVTVSDAKQMWLQAMEDMCGNSSEMRLEILEAALQDARVSEQAKAWLMENFKK